MKSLFEEVCEKIEGCSVPKQFATESLKVRGVASSIPIEEAMRINQNFQEACNLIQAEECQALSVMNDIVAGGSYTKKLR